MYILDTNVFSTMGSYYPTSFPSLWDRLDTLVTTGNLLSVREVWRELQYKGQSDHIFDWIKKHRQIFTRPSNEEMEIVAFIFEDIRFRGLVKESNIYKGRPVADPFLVASGKVRNATVVTEEKFKPDGAKIPTVCKELGVACINLKRLLEIENIIY